MNELALFAGAGGGILGGHLLGWRTVCAVERDAYAAAVLAQRQTDGCLLPFPIWSDITTFDGRPWRGLVDVVSGGFPCQDISAAGRGAGISGERSGLWREMARVIREVGPRYVLVENSPVLTSRGLGTVLGDLAEMGFDARWGVLGAVHAGAPHKRERIWIVAHSTGRGFAELRSSPRGAGFTDGLHQTVPDSDCIQLRQLSGGKSGQGRSAEPSKSADHGESGYVADTDQERWLRWAGELGQRRGLELEDCCDDPHPDCLRQLQPEGVDLEERRRACDVCKREREREQQAGRLRLPA